MDSQALTELYEMMDLPGRLKLLIKLSFNLTVVARNTYTPGNDNVERPIALRGIVEICHRVVGRVQSISNNQGSISTRDFLDSLFGLAELYGCLFELRNAIAFSLENLDGIEQ